MEEELNLNPWVSWWTKPRETIQQIIDENPSNMAIPLVCAGGVLGALDRASLRSLGDTYELAHIILLSAIAGPLGGLIGWAIFAALLRWTGKWLGGEGESEDIRAAIAWYYVPLIWISPLWIIQISMLGNELFTTETPRLDSSPILAIGFLLTVAVEIVVAVWAIILFFRALGQVQKFSALKAFINSLLAALTIVIPVLVVAGAAIFIFT